MNRHRFSLALSGRGILCWVLLLVFSAVLVRGTFPGYVASGAAQFLFIPVIAAVLWHIHVFGVQCPRWLIGGAIVGVLALTVASSFVESAVAWWRPPVVIVARFDGDIRGEATARFAEQMRDYWERCDLSSRGWLRFLRGTIKPILWDRPGSPLFVAKGTERRLTISLPPSKSRSLRAVANPELAPSLPPLQMWRGGVSFGLSVDRLGATAQFLVLLAEGMMTEDESGDLSLIDAGKMAGLWTSLIHRAVPLALAAERRIVRALRGRHIQRAYLDCAVQVLSRALKLGDFSKDVELLAALRTNYGVALWLHGEWTDNWRKSESAKRRAISSWRSVIAEKRISEAARAIARANKEWATGSLRDFNLKMKIPRKKALTSARMKNE